MAIPVWLPAARRNPGRHSGMFAAGYAAKLVWHTTESDVFRPGATYFGHSGWPHFTLDSDGTLWQHLPLDRAARSLKNARGGVETNRGGAIQIEVVGRSKVGRWSPAQMTVAKKLVALFVGNGIIEPFALRPGPIVNSARTTAPQRMSAVEWRTFNGVCGHRHVPENDHWDPGAFDLTTLLPNSQQKPVKDDEMIFYGDTGHNVSEMQRILNGLLHRSTLVGDFPGVPALDIDGAFGPATLAALEEASRRAQRYVSIALPADLRRDGVSPVRLTVLTLAVQKLGELTGKQAG